MKRAISLLVTFIMVISLFPVAALADDESVETPETTAVEQTSTPELTTAPEDTPTPEPTETDALMSETPSVDALFLRFLDCDRLDGDGSGHTEVLCLADEAVKLEVKADTNGTLRFRWQALDQISTEADPYVDIDIDDELSADERLLKLTVDASVLGIKDYYRCAVSATFGDETLVAYSYYTLKNDNNDQPTLIPVESIVISPESEDQATSQENQGNALAVGETKQLKATVYPENATCKDVVWSSSDESVASVNETGLVSAIMPGSVTITATANDGSMVSDIYNLLITEKDDLDLNTASWNGWTTSSNKVQELINCALAQLGKSRSELGYSSAWCAMFISSCAAKVGIADNIIPNPGNTKKCLAGNGNYYGITYAWGLGQVIVEYYGGRYLSSSETPKMGDLVVFNGDHIGIMVDSTSYVSGNIAASFDDLGYIVRKCTVASCWGGDWTKDNTKYVRPNYGGSNPPALSASMSVSDYLYYYAQSATAISGISIPVSGSVKVYRLPTTLTNTVSYTTSTASQLIATSSVVNHAGNTWYQVSGGFVYSGDVKLVKLDPYTSKISIGTTNATMARTISVSGASISDVTSVGFMLCDSSGNQLKDSSGRDIKKTETPIPNGSVINAW